MPERPATTAQKHGPTGPGRKHAHGCAEERWVVGLLLACGALPWLGYWVLGAWDQRELALATLVLAFTLRGLFGRRRASERSRRNEWTSST